MHDYQAKMVAPLPIGAHQAHQHPAEASGAHLVGSLEAIHALIKTKRSGVTQQRVRWLAPSMGDLALQLTVEH